MFNFKLSSKKEVNNFKEKFRTACDEQGIRLGNNQHKSEAIIASMFGFKNFNTLLGAAIKPNQEPQIEKDSISFNQLDTFVERVHVTRTTYGAADKVLRGIKESRGIKLIIFAARDGESNESATTVLIIAESGSLLYDETLLTVERRPRELEVVDIFRAIKDKGLLASTRYIPHRFDRTESEPADAVAKKIVNAALEPVFPDWQGFLAMFNKKQTRYGEGIYADEYWEELKGSLD
jgi:hypothetical protein